MRAIALTCAAGSGTDLVMAKAIEDVTREAPNFPLPQRLALADCLLESAEAAPDPRSGSDMGRRNTWPSSSDRRRPSSWNPLQQGHAGCEATAGAVKICFGGEAKPELLDAISYYEEIPA